jgi:hypothetical protein
MSPSPKLRDEEKQNITVDADKFDEVLRRLLNSKPTSKEEISAKIKAQREARRAPVQQMDKIKKYQEANKKRLKG